jgi:hypothetical protein
MKLKLLLTEAERQRARTRIVLNFYGVILVVTLLYGAIVAVHYLLGWW